MGHLNEEIAKKLYPEWDWQAEEAELKKYREEETSEVNSSYEEIDQLMVEALKEPSMTRSNDIFFFV